MFDAAAPVPGSRATVDAPGAPPALAPGTLLAAAIKPPLAWPGPLWSLLEEPAGVEGQRGLGGARPATGRRRVAPPWRCTPPLAPFAAPAHAGKLQWFEMQARKAFNDLFKAFVPYLQ